MNQVEFLRRLEAALAGVPAAEREEILADYRAYFDDARSDGRSEEEVAAALGDPLRLARELTAEHRLKAWERHKTPGNLGLALLALAGLGVLNMLLLLPYLFFMTVLSSLWVGALGMLLAGVLMTSGWVSHALFGWPALQTRAVSERIIQQPGLAEINISGDDNAHVTIRSDASGAQVHIEASDAHGQVLVEHGANGDVTRVLAQDGHGKVEVSGLQHALQGGMLVAGLVLMLLGALGSLVGWKILLWVWRGTGSWLRWQWERVRSGPVR